MDKVKEIISTWIAAKGLVKITKMILALVFAIILLGLGGFGKVVAILCIVGFIKCLF